MRFSRTQAALAVFLVAGMLGACAKKPMEAAHRAVPQVGHVTEVAHFDHQATGVTVARDGRIFVSFPRWTEDTPVSVAQVHRDGSITPYPNAEWNRWRRPLRRSLDAEHHFICVQSVAMDHHDQLWVLDSGAPEMDGIVPSGPKLVRIDPARNRSVQIIPLNHTVVPEGAYLNDMRFSPDDHYAFITDSGRGAIVVVDLYRGDAWRVLDGDAATHFEPGVRPQADGRTLLRNGKPMEVSADGIAISRDGKYLYWQALAGRTLYRVPTSLLENPDTSPKRLRESVEKVGQSVVADGLLTGADGSLYIASPERDAVLVRDADGKLTVLAQDARLRWPDTLAQGPDGSLYVTASHIQDSPWFNPNAKPQVPSALFRVER
jgi:sugar lactone lactonase YvrE